MRIIILIAIIGALLPGCKKDTTEETTSSRAQRVDVTDLAGTKWVRTGQGVVGGQPITVHTYYEFTADSMFQTDDLPQTVDHNWFHYSYTKSLPVFTIKEAWWIRRFTSNNIFYETWSSQTSVTTTQIFVMYGDSLYGYLSSGPNKDKHIVYGVKEK